MKAQLNLWLVWKVCFLFGQLFELEFGRDIGWPRRGRKKVDKSRQFAALRPNCSLLCMQTVGMEERRSSSPELCRQLVKLAAINSPRTTPARRPADSRWACRSVARPDSPVDSILAQLGCSP